MSRPMRVHCGDCGEPIVSADVDLSSGLARCRACDGVTDARRQLASPTGLARASTSTSASLRPRPEGLAVIELGPLTPPTRGYRDNDRALRPARFERRWFAPVAVFMVFFCLAWDSFLAVWWFMALRSGHYGMAVFTLGHVVAGAWMTYSTASTLVNRSVLTLTDEAVSVRHGPLPWGGNVTLAREDVRQWYCVEGAKQPRGVLSASGRYRLMALLRDGSSRELWSLPDAQTALFLKHELSDRMGLPVTRVAGELPG